MGFFFRRSKQIGKNTRLNVSHRSASVSKRFGLFTLSSKGNVNVRMGKGIGFRTKLW